MLGAGYTRSVEAVLTANKLVLPREPAVFRL